MPPLTEQPPPACATAGRTHRPPARGLRPIAAVAGATIREAVRSRTLGALATILVAVLVLLPLTVRGDGTRPGEVRILLRYALAFMAWIGGAAALWAGCGAVSRDIESGRIRLLLVKPLGVFRLWLGRWLGLTCLNALFLAFAGLAVWTSARWKAQASDLSESDRREIAEHILTDRLRLVPPEAPIEPEVNRRFAILAARGGLPEGIAPEEVRRQLRAALVAERGTVAPDRSKTWAIPVPASIAPDAPAHLRVRMAPARRAGKPIAGRWEVATEPAGPFEPVLSFEQDMGGPRRATVPAGRVRPGGRLFVRFVNGPPEASGTLVFSAGPPVELLVRHGSFEANLARGLLTIGARLALLTALGLTAGCLFSFPVAAFVAVALLCATPLSAYVASPEGPLRFDHHGHPMVPSLPQLAGERMAAAIRAVARPARGMAVTTDLADGVSISTRACAASVAVSLGLYGSLLAALGAAALRRREMAGIR